MENNHSQEIPPELPPPLEESETEDYSVLNRTRNSKQKYDTRYDHIQATNSKWNVIGAKNDVKESEHETYMSAQPIGLHPFFDEDSKNTNVEYETTSANIQVHKNPKTSFKFNNDEDDYYGHVATAHHNNFGYDIVPSVKNNSSAKTKEKRNGHLNDKNVKLPKPPPLILSTENSNFYFSGDEENDIQFRIKDEEDDKKDDDEEDPYTRISKDFSTETSGGFNIRKESIDIDSANGASYNKILMNTQRSEPDGCRYENEAYEMDFDNLDKIRKQ